MASLLESVTNAANTQSENSSVSSAQRSRSPVSTQADSPAQRVPTPAIAQDESSDNLTPAVDTARRSPSPVPEQTEHFIGQASRSRTPVPEQVDQPIGQAGRSYIPVPEQEPIDQFIDPARRGYSLPSEQVEPTGRVGRVEIQEQAPLANQMSSHSAGNQTNITVQREPFLEVEQFYPEYSSSDSLFNAYNIINESYGTYETNASNNNSSNIWHNNDVLVGAFERDTLTDATSIDVCITTLEVEPVMSANGVLDLYGWSYKPQSGMSSAIFSLDFSMGASTNEIDYGDRSIYPQSNAVSINADFTASSVI
jgi:hypothetical protein